MGGSVNRQRLSLSHAELAVFFHGNCQKTIVNTHLRKDGQAELTWVAYWLDRDNFP